MRYHKGVFISRLKAIQHRRETQYSKLYEIPSNLLKLASQDSESAFKDITKARRKIWHDIYLLIGKGAMDELDKVIEDEDSPIEFEIQPMFDARTTVKELIEFRSEMQSNPETARKLREISEQMV